VTAPALHFNLKISMKFAQSGKLSNSSQVNIFTVNELMQVRRSWTSARVFMTSESQTQRRLGDKKQIGNFC
jgi:hypothetical protein